MKTVSEYMMDLHKELVAKRGITETSASQYIRSLYSLNNTRPFTNLAWLKNKESVDQRLSEFSENTQKSLLATVVAALSLVKDKPTYKKIYSHYYTAMMEKGKAAQSNDTSVKTEKQEMNWLSWDVVKSHVERLGDEIKGIGKEVSVGQWDVLLSYALLSLFTEFEPRRNQDYQFMDVVKTHAQATAPDRNYYVLTPPHFMFRKYKTSKTHGEQSFPVPPALVKCLNTYLAHHPALEGKKVTAKTKPFPLLVHRDGSPLVAVNSITRILNRIFGKQVGATQLRHIFLSYKYDVKDMDDTAEKMGHTGTLQREYMKDTHGGAETVQEVTLPMSP